MPFAQDDLLVRVKVDATGAIQDFKVVDDEVGNLGKHAEKTDKSLHGMAESLKDSAIAALGLESAIALAERALGAIEHAFEAVAHPVEESIDAYRGYAGAVLKLSAALKVQGETSEDAIAHYEHLAEQLEHTTTLSEEQTLKMAALGKAIRIPTDTLELMIKNSAGLAYVMGGTAEDAFQAQMQSLKGNARALAAYDIRLKDMTEEMARSGKGVELLAQKFGSFGEAQAKTYGGTLIQIKNITEKIFKEIGEFFFKAFDLKGRALFKKEILEEVLHLVLEIKPKLMEIADTILEVKAKVNDAFKAINFKDLLDSVINLGTAFAVMFGAIQIVKFVQFASALGALSSLKDAAAGVQLLSGALANSGLAQGIQSFVLSGAKLILVSVAFIAIAASVDIVIRNFSHLGDLVTVVGNIFWSFLLKLSRGLQGIALAFSTTMISALESIKGTVLDVGGFTDNLLVKHRKSAMETSDTIDNLNKQIVDADKAASGAAKNVDWGFLGQFAKFFASLLGDANGQMKETADNAGKVGGEMEAIVKLSQEFLDALKAIRNENLGLAQKLAEFGLEEADRLQVALAFDLARIEAKREDIAVRFKGHDAEIKALNAELDVQTALTDQVAERMKFQAMLGAFSPEAQAVGETIGAVVESVSHGFVSMVESVTDDFSASFLEVGDETVKKIVLGAAELFDAAESVLSPLFEAGAAMFSPDAVGDLVEGMKGLANLPRDLLKVFQNLGSIVDQFIKMLPQTFAKLADALPGIIGKIIDKIPELIDAVAEALDKIITKLPAIFARLFDALPDIIAKIMDVLPGLIKSVFKALGSIVAELITALPDIINELLEGLPDIIEALIEGLTAGAGDITAAIIDMLASGGVEKIVGALLRAIPRIAVALVNGFVIGLKQAASAIFGGLDIPDIGGDLAAKLGDAAKKVLDVTTGVSDSVFKVIDLQAAARSNKLSEEISQAVDSSTDRMRSVLEGLMSKLRYLWDWVKDHIFAPIQAAFESLWATIKQIFDFFVNAVTALWNGIIQPIFDAFVNGFQNATEILQQAWDTVLATFQGLVTGLTTFASSLGGLVTGAFTSLTNMFSGSVGSLGGIFAADGPAKKVLDLIGKPFENLWNNIVSPIVDKLSGAGGAIFDALKTKLDGATSVLADMGGKIFNGLKAGFDAAASTYADVGGKIWDGLKNALGNATSTFTNIGTSIWNGLKSGITGIGSLIQDQLNSIVPKNIFNKMFNMSGAFGDKGKVENVLGIDIPYMSFATGGVVPGNAIVPGDSPLNDRILGLLSPGEIVVPRSVVDLPGVRAYLEGIMSGKVKVPAFYSIGDVVDDVTGGGDGGIGSVFGDLADQGKAGFSGLGQLGQDGIDALTGFLEGLDPSKLWDKVMDKVGDGVMEMFSSNRFAEGGYVGSPSPSPMASSMLFPSQPTATSTVVTNNYNITLQVTGTRDMDEDKLAKKVMDNLMTESARGKKVIDQRGIRTR